MLFQRSGGRYSPSSPSFNVSRMKILPLAREFLESSLICLSISQAPGRHSSNFSIKSQKTVVPKSDFSIASIHEFQNLPRSPFDKIFSKMKHSLKALGVSFKIRLVCLLFDKIFWMQIFNSSNNSIPSTKLYQRFPKKSEEFDLHPIRFVSMDILAESTWQTFNFRLWPPK